MFAITGFCANLIVLIYLNDQNLKIYCPNARAMAGFAIVGVHYAGVISFYSLNRSLPEYVLYCVSVILFNFHFVNSEYAVVPLIEKNVSFLRDNLS